MPRRIYPFILISWLLVLAACSQATDSPTAVPSLPPITAVTSPITPPTDPPAPTDSPTAVSALLNTSVPSPTAAPPTLKPEPTPSPLPLDLSISEDDVYLYPVPEIYAGEKVTFQILAYVPDNITPQDVTVNVLVDYQDIADGTLEYVNLGGDAVALFTWAWDTTGEPGEHLVHVILDRYDTIQAGDENEDNNQVALTVNIQDQTEMPIPQRDAVWVTAETDCCTVHVVSGTAAYRDLTSLLTATETAVNKAAARLDVEPTEKLHAYFIDRVIGQGGYAGNAMVVSYLDRQYSGAGLAEVLTHEAVHILDRQFAPDRISFLAEGVAVWASGGHYRTEDLGPRSAALITLGQYVPLPQLIDNFYPVQHEIGYLEAAGFVQYLIEQYGWPQFRAFYADVTADDAPALSEAVDLNLQQYFGITLAEAEADWLASMEPLEPDDTAVLDLQTSIRYYNTMRRYQQAYDPTAYFLTAWLPYPGVLQEEGNPADLTRHPRAEINVTLEIMLASADAAMRQGDYKRANALLDSVARVLDNDGRYIDPLALSYHDIVHTAAIEGYEVQQAELNGSRAIVKVTRPNLTTLSQLDFVLSGQTWVLSD
ncbi:MAG TPA: hypothetical protein EYP41_21495 [Anaerolineae bacterium]|nr:hypothetical protein [Anaerolineae bacterium]